MAESVQSESAEAVAKAKAELLQVFGPGGREAGGGGAAARAADFSRVLPGCSTEAVRQALETLAEEGSVEVSLLSDGAAVYRFVRQ